MKPFIKKTILIATVAMLVGGTLVAQVCTPTPAVCVPSGGYAFQWQLDTDFGLVFNAVDGVYEFTGGGGGLSSMFTISAANGDLSIPGGGALQVAGNKYAFQYTGDQDFGLFFNESDEQYEFRNQDADPVVAMDAIKGNTVIGDVLNSDAYKLRINVPATETTSQYALWVDQSTDASFGYGVFVDVDASAGAGTGTRYGVFSDLDNFGTATNNSSLFGFYTSVDGQGNGSKYGVYATLPGNTASTGNRYGVYSSVSQTGTGGSYYSGYFTGAPLYVSDRIGVGTNAPAYSLDIEMDDKTRGVNIENNYSSTSSTYGVRHYAANTSATGVRYGIYNFMSGGTGTRYGLYNSMSTSTSTSSHYGVYNFISSLATTGTRYGVYSSVTGGTNLGYAGYFVGRTYISSNYGLVVGTSTKATGYLVSVNGKIICEELKVQNSADWPDYVFDEEYELMPLDELEQNIEENNHLPGIPTAEVVEEEGFHVGEMTNKMMEKIEELTLYTIQQQKEIDELKEQLKSK